MAFFTNMKNQSSSAVVQVNWGTVAASTETEGSALTDDEHSAVYVAYVTGGSEDNEKGF